MNKNKKYSLGLIRKWLSIEDLFYLFMKCEWEIKYFYDKLN